MVNVIEPYTGGPLAANGPAYYRFEGCEAAWVIESLGRAVAKIGMLTGEVYLEQITAMADSCLRPLRDNDSEDEMVSRVGRAPVSTLNTKPREHA